MPIRPPIGRAPSSSSTGTSAGTRRSSGSGVSHEVARPMPLGAAAWVTVPDPPATARVLRRPFAALRGRNYRLYFGGQVISQAGSMMQVLAQAWLVLSLTGSSVALGAITAAQFLPMLVGGPYAGVLTDRLDKRRLLLCTQTASLLLSALIA